MSQAWKTTMTSVMKPSGTFCRKMKVRPVIAWPPKNSGWVKASPMKLPIGSTSSLIIEAISDALVRRKRGSGIAQHPVEKLEAQQTQHALAHPALVGVDVALEAAIDRDEQEEGDGQREQVGQAVELEAVEQLDRRADQPLRQRHIGGQERGGIARILEAATLDRAVDDLLGQVEAHEIEGHRCYDDEQHPELIATRIHPDVFEKVRLDLVQGIPPARIFLSSRICPPCFHVSRLCAAVPGLAASGVPSVVPVPLSRRADATIAGKMLGKSPCMTSIPFFSL